MSAQTTFSTIHDRYEVRQEIGRGSMGVVHLAYDRFTGETVALKRVTSVLPTPAFDSTPALVDFKLALANEFRTLASLRHPNIISVIDYGFDDLEQPYFTMAYIGGARTVLDGASALTLEAGVNRLIQVLQALAYLHRRRTIHCDLKPENVLVDRAGDVKLLDFGLAAQFNQSRGIAGSLPYMAPEMLSHQAMSEATDLYAVGILAYVMFTDQHPFQNASSDSLVRYVLEVTPDMEPVAQATHNKALTNVIARLLMKDPTDRYAHAQAVIVDLCRAIDVPLPAETTAIRDSYLQAAQFVGRERELATLSDGLAQVVEGRGSSWLIGGESGIGKSRLIDELRIRALVRGITVLSGQAVEGGGLPYQLWRDVVRHLAIAVEMSPAEAGILQSIVPDMHLFKDVIPPPLLEPEAEQRRLVMTMGNVVRRWPHPLLLLLEDLHWSQESLAPLKLLSTIAPELSLMIVGSYRTDEDAYLYGQLPNMALLRLDRLSDQDVESLSRSMLGKAGGQPQILRLMRDQTEGNALFAVEIARTLAEEAGGLAHIGQSKLPSTIAARGIVDVVQRRLKRLPAEVLPRLRFAAIAGRDVDISLLELSAASEPIHIWLWLCAEAAIFEVINGRWRFSHDRIRDGVLAGIDDSERAQLHREVALAIEQLHPDDAAYAATLYDHWRHAGNRDRMAFYAQQAAMQALRVGELGVAQRYLDDALSVLSPEDNARAGVLVRLARVHLQRTEYALAEPLLNEAQQLALAGGNLHILTDVDTERGRMCNLRSDYDQAIAFGEAAIARARDLGDLVREVEALEIAAVGYMRNGDLEKAGPLFARGLELARESGDPALVVKTMRNSTVVPYFEKRYEEAYAMLQDVLRLARELLYHEIILTTLGNLSLMAWQLGKLDEAVTYAHDNLAISETTGERWSVAQINNLLGFIYLDREELATARKHLTAALVESQRVEAASVALDTLAGFARIAISQGDDERAMRLLGLALSHPASSSEVRMTIDPILSGLRERYAQEVVESALEVGAQWKLDAIIEELTSGVGDVTSSDRE